MRQITTLFLDIGGVLLSNGWDRYARRRAVDKFHLDFDEVDERHHMTLDTYEEGKLSLEEYLNRVIFYQRRTFSFDEFRDFMFSQSKPIPDMLSFIRELRQRYDLLTIAVSNEGRELTEFRIEKFKLTELIDAFVSSCFVHFRKPDKDMFRMALDISQARPEDVVYIDDRAMFVEVAGSLDVRGIHHTDFNMTRAELAEMGLSLD